MIRSASIARQALLAPGLILITLVIYWPSSATLWAYWTQNGSRTADGPLIALISLWLLFRSRHALATAPVEPALQALPAIFACSVGSLLFWRAGIETLQLALLPALIWLAVLGALGPRTAGLVAFPVGFLYFAVPGWGYLWPTLQQLTVWAVRVLALLVRLPAHFSGDIVSLPGVGMFEIGSKCSGVDFFVVGLAIAALIGELERASLRRRAWLMALMGAIAIASNWVRVFLIIVIGYASDMRNPFATSDHLLFGWIVFAAALLLYLWLVPRASRDAAGAVGGARAPAPRAMVGYLAGIVALGVLPAGVYAMDLLQGPDTPALEIAFPRAEAPWTGPLTLTDTSWRPEFVGPHAERQTSYAGPAASSVEVVAIGYSRQGQGRELVNDENSLLGRHGLTAIAYDGAAAGGERFRELIAEDPAGRRSVIWWLYTVGGRRFSTPFYSQLWYGFHALVRPLPSVLYAFRASCDPSCGAARATLRGFLGSNANNLFTAVREPRPISVRSHA